MERCLELHPGTPQRGFDHWFGIDFQYGPEFLGFQKLEVHLIRYCTELLKGRMQKICDDIAEGPYDFFLETQIDCLGSYPQLATAELDEKRQWGIQEQVVTLQPEFASLGKYESFTDFIEDSNQMETVVFGGNCLKIGADVCDQLLKHVLCGMFTISGNESVFCHGCLLNLCKGNNSH